MKRRLLLAIAALSITITPVAAQEETKVVLRISRELIRELTDINFTKDDPIATNSGGASVIGSAHTEGEFDVKILKSESAANFDLHASGTVHTQMTATRRPVIVCAHGDGSFNATCRMVLENHQFRREAVHVIVHNHSTMDGIASFRGGLIGALTRGLARPAARRGVLDGERETAAQIHAKTAQEFEVKADKLVESLNQLEKLAAKVKDGLKKEGFQTQDLQPIHAATDDYLWLSVGRPGSRMANLPTLDPAKAAPLELWITRKDKKVNQLVSTWNENQSLVMQRIGKKATALLLRVRIESIPDWHIARFTPDVSKIPDLKLPN